MTKLLSARFLLAGLIVLLIVLLVLAVVSNMQSTKVAVVHQLLSSDEDLAMSRLNYTETRDGVKKWSVQAESASHDLKQETAQLKQLTLTLYDPSASDVTVTSLSGEMDLKKRQVLLQGDVVMKAATGETVYTDELLFVESKKMITTDHFVRLITDAYTLSGKGMRFDITDRSLILQSQVEGLYHEGLNVK
jgi:LPS export ABC transporter protein LptC